jgi:hypothetical protein
MKDADDAANGFESKMRRPWMDAIEKNWNDDIGEKTSKVKINKMPDVNIRPYEKMTMEERVDDGLNAVRGILAALAIELGFLFFIVMAVLIFIAVFK